MCVLKKRYAHFKVNGCPFEMVTGHCKPQALIIINPVKRKDVFF